jgi:hypothetical protein
MLMQQFIGEAIDESVLQKLSQSEKNAAYRLAAVSRDEKQEDEK